MIKTVPNTPAAVAVNEQGQGVVVCKFMGEIAPWFISPELAQNKNNAEMRRLFKRAVAKFKAGRFAVRRVVNQ